MVPQPYPFIIKKAVDSGFLQHVLEIIEQQNANFSKNNASSNRQFLKMDYVTPEGDAYLFDTKTALARTYDLGDYIPDPKLQDFIGYITEGGAIHEHTDPDVPGSRHVRINVLVKQPGGCIPLLEGVPIAVEEGDAWLNLASLCKHSTTPVEGPGFRSAISFGFQIDLERGEQLYAVHKSWMESVRAEQGDEGLPARPAAPPVRPAAPGRSGQHSAPSGQPSAQGGSADAMSQALADTLNGDTPVQDLGPLLAPGALLLAPRQPSIRGADNVARAFGKMMRRYRWIRILPVSQHALGQAGAVETGFLSAKLRQSDDQIENFKYQICWEATAGGWQLLSMMWNQAGPAV